MTLLNDLSDDCLIEVLEWLSPNQLFKMQRLNKRLKRLAAVKMLVKIMAIRLCKPKRDFSKCPHLDAISQDQTLIMNKNFSKCFYQNVHDSSKPIFFSILNKCSNVKSIDFRYFRLVNDFFAVVRWCTELECLKLGEIRVKKEEWERILNRIGHKLVHFAKESLSFEIGDASDTWIMKTIAEKCPNIKHVDWRTNKSFNDEFKEAIKLMPNGCWINFYCDSLNRAFFVEHDQFVYEDIVDELRVGPLYRSYLGDRLERLSSLTFYRIEGIRGVDFAGLKKLDFNGVQYSQGDSLDCLIASQFPQLEEFRFNSSCGLNEFYYDKLFQRMTTVTKLTIFTRLYTSDLPRTAICQLVKLKIIVFELNCYSMYSSNFIQLCEWYVEKIKSLKKLVFDLVYVKDNKKSFRDAIEKLKQKQSRVAIEIK